MTAPNILFILADDMGAWALGCAGNAEIRTPNLDRLAARGMRFSNAFCVSPVCSPARASLLTGMIPSRHGVHDWIRRGNSPGESLDGAVVEYLAGLPTYTEVLAAHGYTCALSGKWHLGNAPRVQKGHRFWRAHARGGGPYYNAPMLRDGREEREPRYVTDVITENALEFLAGEAAGAGAGPFYLGVHYTAPHSPWGRGQHPPCFFDPYFERCPFQSVPDEPMHPWQINTAPWGAGEKRREFLSGYYAAVTAMDAGIGRLLDALDARGLTEKTLIVFTSDNGMNMGHHGIYGKGNGTFPQNFYDTSVKVPFLVSCPGQIAAGAVCDALLSHYDFLPTLLDFVGLAGLESAVPAGLPGTSLADLWRGHSTDRGEEEVIVLDEYGPARMIRARSEKYVHRHPDGPHEFYDLAADPGENHNLIGSERHQPRIASLRQRLEAWFARYAEADRDGRFLPVTGKGQIDALGSGAGKLFEDDWFYLRDRPDAAEGEP